MAPLTSGDSTLECFSGWLHAKAGTVLVLSWVFCVFIVLDGHSSQVFGQETFYAVQTGSFKKFQNAARALAHFQKKGFEAFCRYQDVEGQGKWFRIYVGRLETERQAQETAQRLMDEAGDGGVLVKKVKEPANPYYLHVGSYAMRARAEQEIRQQGKYLLEPFVKEEYVSGQRWFRIYVGPFANAEDALAAGTELKDQGMISYFKPFRRDKDTTVSQAIARDVEKEAMPAVPKNADEKAASTVASAQDRTTRDSPSEGTREARQVDSTAVAQQEGSFDGKEKGPSLSQTSGNDATPDPGQFHDALKQAETLMAQGNAAAAYALLAPLEVELAGNMDYDYLLAISALDSGNPAKASLVFERILAVRPEFAGARLDIARAYYALGNYDQAKAELETVLTLNPPPQAKAVSEQYLVAIEKAAEEKDTTLSGYVEARLGYDTNVNNSTDREKVYVPALAVNMALSPTNVKSEDMYGALAGGASLQHRLKGQLWSYLDVDGALRRNSTESAFDLDGLMFRGGLRVVETRDSYRMGLRAGRSWLDGSTYRNTVGLEGDWRRLINERNQLALFGQYSQNRYPDYEINDADQILGGLSWLHAIVAPYKPILFASAYIGSEEDKNGRADGGRILYGLRVGGQAKLNEQTYLFANTGGLYGDYDKTNVSFLQTREDLQYDFRFGLHWRPLEDWTITPQIAYIENDSNIDIYEYDRTDVSLTVRRDFN
jgi:cell division septation protein DedD